MEKEGEAYSISFKHKFKEINKKYRIKTVEEKNNRNQIGEKDSPQCYQQK